MSAKMNSVSFLDLNDEDKTCVDVLIRFHDLVDAKKKMKLSPGYESGNVENKSNLCHTTSTPTKRDKREKWTPEQDAALRTAVSKYGAKKWKSIAADIPGNRSPIQCLQRWGKVLKPGLIKGPWTDNQDELLRTYVALEPKGSWAAVAEHVPGRTAKQCRERWSLCLDPNIRKDDWTPEEDDSLRKLHQVHGNSWALIAKHLPGRTENATKLRFKSLGRMEVTKQKRMEKEKSL
jgi:hypothetical protein